MDTSKEYIKMCDCPEIQKPDRHNRRDLKRGDFYLASSKTLKDPKTFKHPNGRYREINVYYSWKGVYNYIWLPRQDQLQEMYLDGISEDRFVTLDRFLNFVDSGNRGWSFEQLWLAFVMKEKFNKTWNGKEWVSQ